MLHSRSDQRRLILDIKEDDEGEEDEEEEENDKRGKDGESVLSDFVG